jgi:hypothetical protein
MEMPELLLWADKCEKYFNGPSKPTASRPEGCRGFTPFHGPWAMGHSLSLLCSLLPSLSSTTAAANQLSSGTRRSWLVGCRRIVQFSTLSGRLPSTRH